MKFPKEIKGLEEKINRFTRLQSELGASNLDKNIDNIKAYLDEEIHKLNNLEIKSDRYSEPSKYNDILKASKSPKDNNIVNDQVYLNKLKGAIYGRFAGCALGAPVELLSIGELKSFLLRHLKLNIRLNTTGQRLLMDIFPDIKQEKVMILQANQ